MPRTGSTAGRNRRTRNLVMKGSETQWAAGRPRQPGWIAFAGAVWLGAVAAPGAGFWPYLAVWDFNSPTPDGQVTTGRWDPASGWGLVRPAGGVTGTFGSGAGSSDPAGWDDSAVVWRGWPAQGTENRGHGWGMTLNGYGWHPEAVVWDWRVEPGASRHWRLQFRSPTGEWVDGPALQVQPGAWMTGVRVRFPPWCAAMDVLEVRWVSEFEASALGRGAAAYVAADDRAPYDPSAGVWLDHVRVVGAPTLQTVRVVTWNLSGFGMTNWHVGHPQLSAAARVLRTLTPEVVGFQELPEGWEPGMTNWVASWWPGATVVVGSFTDGALRLALATRLPVRAVRSWLRRVPLPAWGSDDVFTRELLEAEVCVPGCADPLHLFVMHLKAGTDADSAARRAAEARAISNFFATAWPARSWGRAVVLLGDCNEDVARPRPGEQGAIRILGHALPGLTWLTPVNPVTGDERTWSIRDQALRYRFDYLFVGGWLVSNVVASGVFRSDLTPGGPAGVQVGDSPAASDHLPVWAAFANPAAVPQVQLVRTETNVWRLIWWTASGQRFRVEGSPDLAGWQVLEETVGSRPGILETVVEGDGPTRFFRVLRLD